MNKSQYKRLLLVLLIPLLALGWWVAEDEIVISHHHLTECEELREHFSCVTISTQKKVGDEYRANSGGVFLWTGARLSLGFHAPVITTGELEWRDGASMEKKGANTGSERVLSVSKFAGANYAGNGPCKLSLFANSDYWSLSCINGMTENFKFIDEKTNKKYVDLVNLSKNQAEDFSITSRNAYIFSLVLPLIIFLVASGALYLLMRVFSFIKHGRETAAR